MAVFATAQVILVEGRRFEVVVQTVEKVDFVVVDVVRTTFLLIQNHRLNKDCQISQSVSYSVSICKKMILGYLPKLEKESLLDGDT